jgi:hypothetical protein
MNSPGIADIRDLLQALPEKLLLRLLKSRLAVKAYAIRSENSRDPPPKLGSLVWGAKTESTRTSGRDPKKAAT